MDRYEQDQRREDEASFGEAEYWEGKKSEVREIMDNMETDELVALKKYADELIDKRVAEYAEQIPF